eukprot:TRINITY_DN37402_c0_g1_i1.p1 TRINITY_DN37402_c0_g1~~TRINITY_DN37402_c0_g1_i1.p1  ORF type:complete len:637 (+),score=101.93 TRINITY_DN37402_c0_g1_i1:22-1932(+)
MEHYIHSPDRGKTLPGPSYILPTKVHTMVASGRQFARRASFVLVLLLFGLPAPASAISLNRARVQVQSEAQADATMSMASLVSLLQERRRANNITDNEVMESCGFDEDGYITLVKLESASLMEEYIRRLVRYLGLEIIDEGGLAGVVPHYSGEKSSQTFWALRTELLAAAAVPNSWVSEVSRHDSLLRISVTGGTAPLSEQGYRAVVRLRDDFQMGNFVRRTAASLGLYVADEGRMAGLLPFYSGTKAVQSFASLRSELQNEVRSVVPFVISGSVAALTEAGCAAVTRTNNASEMAHFIARVARHIGCYVVNEEGLQAISVSIIQGRGWSYAALESEVRKECGIDRRNLWYGNVHSVVGEKGVWQIRMNGTRHVYSESQLHAAGIVPSRFEATDAATADAKQLRESCPLFSEPETQRTCFTQAKHMSEPGCKSRAEQAITDSHRRAFIAAKERTDSDWTAIIEDDVVPLHPGFFDEAFQRAWAKVPPETKMVRLGWCSFESDLGPIRRETFADAGEFRLVRRMSWSDGAGQSHYYTGGCTTGYIVHRSLLDELLAMFPCCCPIDCCLERQLFYTRAQPWFLNLYSGKLRGEQIMMNMDAWDSKEDAFNYTSFAQGGVLVQDNRGLHSLRPLFNQTG